MARSASGEPPIQIVPYPSRSTAAANSGVSSAPPRQNPRRPNAGVTRDEDVDMGFQPTGETDREAPATVPGP